MKTCKIDNYKLNEELGFSKDVDLEINHVIDIIIDGLKNKNNYGEFIWDDDKGLSVYGVNFINDVVLFGCYKIKIIVRFGIFSSTKEYIEFCEMINELNEYYFNAFLECISISSIVFRKNFDKQNGILTIDKNDIKLRSTLEHEIKHAYQYFKRNYKDGNVEQGQIADYKEQRIYNISIRLSNDSKNNKPSIIGYAIYYTFPMEITANIQKTWSLIQQNSQNDYNCALEELDNSYYTKMLKYIKNSVLAMENNISTKDINFLEKEYNRSINWIFARIKKGYKNLLRGYGRLKTLIHDNIKQ